MNTVIALKKSRDYTDKAIENAGTLSELQLDLSIDESTYIMTLELKRKEEVLSTQTIDLPLESMITNGSYADGTLTLTLQSGSTIEVDIRDIISGLVNDSRTIAGIDLKDDITAEELIAALGIDTIKTEVAANTEAISAEQERAEGAESTLQTSIETEASTAREAEKNLQDTKADKTALESEVTRATTEEKKISDAVTAEKTRATEQETTLQESIDAEQTRATAAEKKNADAITAEQTRATKKENDLNTALTAEQTRAEEAESGLQDNIDAEKTRATAAEKKNTDAITAEQTRATKKENDLNTALTAEQTRAKEAESGLDGKITAEKTRATKAETDLQNTINSNKPNWDDKYTRSEIDNKFSTLNTGLDWKESVDTFADLATTYPDAEDGWTVNVKDTDYTYRFDGKNWIPISANSIPKATNNIDGILTKEDHKKFDDAANAIPGINSHLSTLDSGLAAETTRATKAEDGLRTDLTAETKRAKGVEEELRTDLTTESDRATKAEGSLRTDLTAETSTAREAEKNLQDTKADKTALEEEATRAKAEEGKLQTALDGKADTEHGTHVPDGGTEGQVLKKTADGVEWGAEDVSLDAEVTPSAETPLVASTEGGLGKISLYDLFFGLGDKPNMCYGSSANTSLIPVFDWKRNIGFVVASGLFDSFVKQGGTLKAISGTALVGCSTGEATISCPCDTSQSVLIAQSSSKSMFIYSSSIQHGYGIFDGSYHEDVKSEGSTYKLSTKGGGWYNYIIFYL